MRFLVSLVSAVVFGVLCLGCAGKGSTATHPRNLAAIEAADLALARGDVASANRAYDEILSKTPDLAAALIGGARAALAAGKGEDAVLRFDAYRAQGEPWQKVEQWEYCAALVLGTEQRLANPEKAALALELAQQLGDEGCRAETSKQLVLRSRLAIADSHLRAGRNSKALERYLDLVGPPKAEPTAGAARAERGKLGRRATNVGEQSPREQAYLSAAKLLADAGRREEALALLSRGLDEFPANRDLVHRMVTLLADGSSVVFPRAKPPGTSRPAATQ